MIRNANINDAHRIARIEAESFKDSPSPLTYEEIYEYLKNPETIVIIDEESGAYLIMVPIPNANAVYIHRIAVPLKDRGKEISIAVAYFAGKIARQRGMTSAIMHVAKENKRAIKIYEGLGFKKIMESNKYYPSGKDAFVMQKNLCKME